MASSALDSKKVAAVGEIRKALRAIPKEDLATFPLSVGVVAAFLDVDPKTLHAARTTRDEKLQKGAPIHPLDLESIPYLKTSSGTTYMALDVIEYVDRRALAPTLPVWKQKLPASYPPLQLPRSFLGFQAWIANADPTELWPFAIQADGRPMDLIAALVNGAVADDVRWLTIRQFGDLAADAASRAFHNEEATALLDASGKDQGGSDEPEHERDRWSTPGGPI
jgi:hypothetical protein